MASTRQARNYFGQAARKLEKSREGPTSPQTFPRHPPSETCGDNLAGARDGTALCLLAEMSDQGFITKRNNPDTAPRRAEVKIIERPPVYDAQLAMCSGRRRPERSKAMLCRAFPGDLVGSPYPLTRKLQDKRSNPCVVERIAKTGKAQVSARVGALVMAKDGRVVRHGRAVADLCDSNAIGYTKAMPRRRIEASSLVSMQPRWKNGFSPYGRDDRCALTIEGNGSPRNLWRVAISDDEPSASP